MNETSPSIVRPSVRELQRHGALYPEWQVCPLCRGGRGEVIPSYDEDSGEFLGYTVIGCGLCQGERVVMRAARS